MFGDVLAFHDRFTACVDPAAVPAPVRFSVVIEGWASLVKVSVALAAPALCGLKVTVNGTLWPAEIVRGSDNPPTLNAELFELAAVTVIPTLPADRFPVAIPLAPAATLPKLRVVGLTPSWPAATDEEREEAPLLTPWQPHKAMKVVRSTNRPADFAGYFPARKIFAVFGIV